MDSFSEKLSTIRNFYKLSQKDMATRLKVGERTYARYENGERVPNIDILNNIAQMGNININWIMSLSDDMFISKDNNLIQLPYFKDTYASAGGGAINYSEAPVLMAFDVEFIKAKLGITCFEDLHIINAIGDSMYPTIKTGELLFINPFKNENNKIKNKDIYVINTLQGILVKRIRVEHPTKAIITLVSDNPADPDIRLEGDEIEACEIIGRVVGHFDGL